MKILGDNNGVLSNSLIVDEVLPGALSYFQQRKWFPEGDKFRCNVFNLQVVGGSPSLTHEGIGQLITHVYTFEADRVTDVGFTHMYKNLSLASYDTEEIEFDWQGVIFDYQSPDAVLKKTLWYKLCTMPEEDFLFFCGHVLEFEGYGGSEVAMLSFCGKHIYTPPTTSQLYDSSELPSRHHTKAGAAGAGKISVMGEMLPKSTTGVSVQKNRQNTRPGRF